MIYLFSIFMFAQHGFALTNSQPALEKYWNANVMIKAAGWDRESQTEAPGYCNATFISNQKLITAAHCLVDAQILQQFGLDIEVGEYKYVTRPNGQVVRAGYVAKERRSVIGKFHFLSALDQKITSQGFNLKIAPEEDMAVIELSAPWVSEQVQMQYPQVLPNEKEFLLSQNLQNKMLVMSLNYVATVTTTDTKRNAVLNNITSKGKYFESQSIPRVEEGDSGSGLYVLEGQQYYLVGVVKGKAETFFSNWDVYVNALPILRAQGF